MRPRVSVCICTRNRPQELRRCLGSIARSTLRVDEIVVSDDSTDEHTADMLRANRNEARYLKGPRAGLGANRNRALLAVGGDYVLFLDDDACLGETFLERALGCAAAHADKSRIIVTGCENNYGTIVRSHAQSFLGFQHVPYGGDTGLKTIVINSTLFPRGLFEVARFDEKLVYGYDEVDIASQAICHGYHIVHSEGAVNFHYPSPVNRSYYKPYLDVSRLYVTFKRYALYEKSYVKAVSFAALAPMHCLLAASKRHGTAGLGEAWRAIAVAARFSFESLRHDPSL